MTKALRRDAPALGPTAVRATAWAAVCCAPDGRFAGTPEVSALRFFATPAGNRDCIAEAMP
jgi:hypothetical protein